MTVDRSAQFDGLPEEFSAALLLAAVVDSSEDAIISQRLDGTIMSWSSAAERLFGWTTAEAVGRSFQMIVPEARRDEFASITARLAQGERIVHLETARTHKDGSEVQLSLTIAPILAPDGHVVGSLGVAHDITEKQRSEEVRALLAAIVESSEDAIVSLDMDGQVTSWNRAAERLYNYSAAEMIGQRYGEILDKDARDDFNRVFAEVAAGARLSHHETARTRRDGTSFEVSMSLAPILAPDGSIVGEAAVLHNITERQRRERDPRGEPDASRASRAHRPHGRVDVGGSSECACDLDERGVPDIRRGGASQLEFGRLLREGPPWRPPTRSGGRNRCDLRGTTFRGRISDRAAGWNPALGLLGR